MRGGSSIGPCPSHLDPEHVHVMLFQFSRVQIVKNSVDNPDAMIWRPRIERNTSAKLVPVLWGLRVEF